jgi:hypothetical protein
MSRQPPLEHLSLDNFALCEDAVHRLKETGCLLSDYAVKPAPGENSSYVKLPTGWQRWRISFPAGSVMLKCPRDYSPAKRNDQQARGEIGIRGTVTDWLFAWAEKEPRRMLRLVKADLLDRMNWRD